MYVCMYTFARYMYSMHVRYIITCYCMYVSIYVCMYTFARYMYSMHVRYIITCYCMYVSMCVCMYVFLLHMIFKLTMCMYVSMNVYLESSEVHAAAEGVRR